MTEGWRLDPFAGRARWRRLLVLVLVLITTAVGLVLMGRIVAARGPEILKPIFLPCFALLFAWIALSFWSGVIGFLLGVLRRHPVTLARQSPVAGPIPPLRERTAILVPVYNEEHSLPRSIPVLREFLGGPSFPYEWRIVIADAAGSVSSIRVAPGWSTCKLLSSGR